MSRVSSLAVLADKICVSNSYTQCRSGPILVIKLPFSLKYGILSICEEAVYAQRIIRF